MPSLYYCSLSFCSEVLGHLVSCLMKFIYILPLNTFISSRFDLNPESYSSPDMLRLVEESVTKAISLDKQVIYQHLHFFWPTVLVHPSRHYTQNYRIKGDSIVISRTFCTYISLYFYRASGQLSASYKNAYKIINIQYTYHTNSN